MDIPWHLCRTIGPPLSQRLPLAIAKAQPRGGGFCMRMQKQSNDDLALQEIRHHALPTPSAPL